MTELYKLPDGWKWVKLGEVCEFEYGTGLPERDRKGGSIPVFGSNGIIGYHNSAITQGPTIIIGRKGSIGQVNYSDVPCWPIDTTYYIDSSKTNCNLLWLYWLLKWLRLDLLNKATGVPGLNREDAYNLVIPLPPVEEQSRIAQILQEIMSEVEKARSACEKQLEAVNALPQAYLRKAFRGEL
ncbi:MAG: restriction endonuclease subunit S [candidate division WOR-3 bacterium]